MYTKGRKLQRCSYHSHLRQYYLLIYHQPLKLCSHLPFWKCWVTCAWTRISYSGCKVFFFLRDHPQQVKVNGSLSSKLSIFNAGVVQGWVLSPVLFSLYTNGCVALKEVCKFIKYADDTAIVGCLSNQLCVVSYLNEIDAFKKCLGHFWLWMCAKLKRWFWIFKRVKIVNLQSWMVKRWKLWRNSNNWAILLLTS